MNWIVRPAKGFQKSWATTVLKSQMSIWAAFYRKELRHARKSFRHIGAVALADGDACAGRDPCSGCIDIEADPLKGLSLKGCIS